jgi:FSR family fosmidomycin resistance protein-like MFS transporter
VTLLKNPSKFKDGQSSAEQLTGTFFHIIAHFANDFFLSFFAPILPVLITQMGLLKVQAGILNLGLELTALSMPLIGKVADKRDIRKYMVLTPAVTAACMTTFGIINSFPLLFLVLFISGVSIYFYHAIGPADIADVKDQAIGRLMAVWNIAGQVAFMIGPLIVTWVITQYSVRSMPWLALIGVIFSVVLIVLWRNSTFSEKEKADLHKKIAIEQRKRGTQSIIRQFIPITGIILLISLSRSVAYAYLPVYIVEKGGSLWMSGLAISLYFGAGIPGNYLGGFLHDRVGARIVAGIALVGFALFFTASIFTNNLFQLFLISLMGVFSFMLMPSIMAMLVEVNPSDRSLTNGLFLGLSYGLIAVAGVLAGYLLDHFPTESIFLISSVLAFLSVFLVPFLVDTKSTL